MKEDKLKKLIENLPKVEPKRPVEKIIWEIIKMEAIKLWERRLSFLLLFLSVLLAFFTVRQAFQVSKTLNSLGFWQLLFWDKSWLATEPRAVFQAMLEANPLKELFLLFFLVTTFAFSLYILFKENEK
ncbi:hypothetical protein C4578_01320 [Candidatus Microgenomates bacterium]|jgi:hypothetical protein|nr:MAG: hypothetical protein C4578_01320 [Candidatus Microgenomates bacterium]